jgi:hypothetical protein
MPGAPLWWVSRLEKKLAARRGYVDLMGRYYVGDHPLPIPHEKVRTAFQRMLRSSRANWTGLIVDAVAERLHVDGFRLGGDQAGDADAWAIWQGNDLDAESELVHTEALVSGETFVTVWNNPKDAEMPLITAEHPSQMVAEADRANPRELAAALKVWEDDWTGGKLATLYLPDGIYKYQAPKQSSEWREREEKLANPLGTVPVAVFRNRPRLITGGRSEIEDVTDIQDRINKTIFDRAMASEYASFRQRYSIGMEIPRDDAGNPKAPFEVAIDHLWMAEDENVKFGEFSATDLVPYIKACESDITMMAAISRTPPHYLLGAMVNISGDALKAAESGLSSKAASRTRQFGEAWERVLRLAFSVLDDPRGKERSSEVIWHDVETRTEGERVDALTKMASLGVPRAALWEKWGAAPQEIDRWQGMAFEEALTAVAAEPLGPRPGAGDLTA